MNWLLIILIVGVIVAVIAYINTGDKGEGYFHGYFKY